VLLLIWPQLVGISVLFIDDELRRGFNYLSAILGYI
jgi:hypothetical protein